MLKKIKEFLKGHPCALPEHLQKRLHDDWPPLLNKLPRAFNARGPRCGEGNPGFKAWPPKLVKGYGIARWQTTGDEKQIFIPDLATRTISGRWAEGRTIRAVDVKPGSPSFNQEVWVNLSDYVPSSLQKFSSKGWMELYPFYRCGWKVLEKNEVPGKTKAETGADKVLFWRIGWRPDVLDQYYNWGPYAGLRWN